MINLIEEKIKDIEICIDIYIIPYAFEKYLKDQVIFLKEIIECSDNETLQFAEWYRRKVLMSNFDIKLSAKEAFKIYKKEFNK